MLVTDVEWPKFFYHSTDYRDSNGRQQILVYRYDSADQCRPLLRFNYHGSWMLWVLGTGSYHEITNSWMPNGNIQPVTAQELITEWGMSSELLFQAPLPEQQERLHYRVTYG